VPGTLSSSTYNVVATCNANLTLPCQSSGARLRFHLLAKPTVKRSGSHTLVMSWKFEII
jgi:hypothetical protein